MGSKEATKAALKEAREAVEAKEYDKALRTCKAILQSDQSNFMAVILTGVSFREKQEYQRSLEAFTRATEVNPGHLLGWKGLASYYEKTNPDSNELLVVYQKILTFYQNDAPKAIETCEKLARVALLAGDLERCLESLRTKIKLAEGDEEKQLEAWKGIVSALSKVPQEKLTAEYSELLLRSLEVVVEDLGDYNNLENFELYLKLLHHRGQTGKLVHEAKRMRERFPNSVCPLEWLGRVYLECQERRSNETAEVEEDVAEEVADKLLEKDAYSQVGKVVKGVVLSARQEYCKAREHLSRAMQLWPTSSVQGWRCLCRCHLVYHDSYSLEESARKVLAKMPKLSGNEQAEALVTEFQMFLVQGLIGLKTDESCNEALNILEKLQESNPKDLLTMYLTAKCYYNLRDLFHLQDCALQLSAAHTDSPEASMASLFILKLNGCHAERLEGLKRLTESNPSMSEAWFELAMEHWDLGEYEASAESLLQCAKRDPLFSATFCMLGHYYRVHQKNKETTRKCYVKAFRLDPRNEDAGTSLSDMLREMGRVEENLEILTFATSCGKSKWAQVRLGLLYSEQGEHNLAVSNLQDAVLSSPGDIHCLESLGDAYYARGSYTSAKKVFQEAMQLDPESSFLAFRVGCVEQILGEYVDCMYTFEALLERHPDYIPAMIHLAETHLMLCRECLRERRDGRAVDHCQEALKVAGKAAGLSPDIPCTWEVLGLAAMVLSPLPWPQTKVKIPATLNDNDEVRLLDLLKLGVKFYEKAVELCPLGSSTHQIWHNVALNYWYQAEGLTDIREKKEARIKALGIIRLVVDKFPHVQDHWTLMGIIAGSSEIEDFPMSQHSFIRAIECNPKSSCLPWTFLGMLYLHLDNAHLAHRAFCEAQRMEPSRSQAWVGQAVIAERTRPEEAIGLLRHSLGLDDVHPQAEVGYASWVLTVLLQGKAKSERSYAFQNHIERLHGVSHAIDALVWFTDRIKTDPISYNMLGMLYEWKKMHRSALDAYKKCLFLLMVADGDNKQKVDWARKNYARCLTTLGETEKALEQYKMLKETDFASHCGLAFASYKAGYLADSYESFNAALEWLAEDDKDRAYVLVAMGILANLNGSVDDAKTLLFQSCQLDPPSPEGLFTLASIAMDTNDATLLSATVKSMGPYVESEKYRATAMHFKACEQSLLHGDPFKGELVLRRAVHKYPWDADLWRKLTYHRLQWCETEDEAAKATAACSVATLALGRGKIDVSELLSLTSLSLVKSGNISDGLMAAKRAVHMFPNSAQNWSSLLAAYMPVCTDPREVKWCKKTVGFVRRQLHPGKDVRKWLSSVEGKLEAILAGNLLK